MASAAQHRAAIGRRTATLRAALPVTATAAAAVAAAAAAAGSTPDFRQPEAVGQQQPKWAAGVLQRNEDEVDGLATFDSEMERVWDAATSGQPAAALGSEGWSGSDADLSLAKPPGIQMAAAVAAVTELMRAAPGLSADTAARLLQHTNYDVPAAARFVLDAVAAATPPPAASAATPPGGLGAGLRAPPQDMGVRTGGLRMTNAGLSSAPAVGAWSTPPPLPGRQELTQPLRSEFVPGPPPPLQKPPPPQQQPQQPFALPPPPRQSSPPPPPRASQPPSVPPMRAEARPPPEQRAWPPPTANAPVLTGPYPAAPEQFLPAATGPAAVAAAPPPPQSSILRPSPSATVVAGPVEADPNRARWLSIRVRTAAGVADLPTDGKGFAPAGGPNGPPSGRSVASISLAAAADGILVAKGGGGGPAGVR
jgi:hypothetical protein